MDAKCEAQEIKLVSGAVENVDDSFEILEDYRAILCELRGNLERLRELVGEQIFLETPPRLRDRQLSRSGHSSLRPRTE
jgi:hypothetical protein